MPFMTRIVLIAVLLATVSLAVADEAELIAVLASDAPLVEKSGACRQLAVVGTRQSVPALAALLTDPALSHMARYALEPIPDPSVDAALRAALVKVDGDLRIGVIHSLGVRRDKQAVEPLILLLPDPAAATALARIGTRAAVAALEKGLPATADACLIAAEQSPRLYDRLLAAPVAAPVRVAALRGAIASGRNAASLISQALRGDDYALAAVAVGASAGLRDERVTRALTDALASLSADRQLIVIQALGARGEDGAASALIPLARAGDSGIRVAAIRSLAQLGSPAALPVLAELASAPEADVAGAARDALAGFPGAEAERAVAALLKDSDPAKRRMGIDLAGRRHMSGAIADLLRAASDEDGEVSSASLKVLAELAGPDDVPALIDVLLTTKQLAAAEQSLTAVCKRTSGTVKGGIVIQRATYGDLPDGDAKDVTRKATQLVKEGAMAISASNDNFGDTAPGRVKKLRIDYAVDGVTGSATVGEGEELTFVAAAASPACVDALCAALPRAKGDARLALLRVLRTAGGPRALEAMRAAAKDPEADVRDAAMRNLCDWPTADALGDLAELAKAPPSPALKILALRGQVRLMEQPGLDTDRKLATLKTAMALMDRPEERKSALSVLGGIPAAGSLAMVMPDVANPAVKAEACIAAVAIAEKLAAAQPALVSDAMRQVAGTAEDEAVVRRARALIR
jgi:HEAT repeat protein